MTGFAWRTLEVLICSAAAANSLSAQTAARLAADGVVPGARIRVHRVAGAILEGKVVALSDSMLVVAGTGPVPASPDSVHLEHVTRLRVRRAPRYAAGAVAGAIVGAGAGYVWWSSIDTEAPLLPGLATLGVAGAGLGLGVAALLPRWRDVPLAGPRP